MILGVRYDARGLRGCERENKYSAANLLSITISFKLLLFDRYLSQAVMYCNMLAWIKTSSFILS